MPALGLTTLRVSNQGVTRISNRWYRALAQLNSGEVVGLPTSETPIALADQSPQKFEQASGQGWQPPALASDVRLYEVDILPTGAVHGLGLRDIGGERQFFGWLALPGTAP